MAAYLKLKDEQTSCHYYYDVTCPNQPVVPCKNSQDQGAKVKQMLPCFPIPTEDMEEDEEEGGVALINIFNPFASWTKS